uniref:TPX2 central domain-containing protein n=1 Tax=Trichuris muris TaxID=70415 RepID=A0A5S6QAL6_TRIMR
MCALEKHWNDNMIHSLKLCEMDNGSWSKVEAPMFADTFSESTAELSDSWFDRFATQTVDNDGEQATPPSSKTPMPSSRMATPRASALSEIFPNCAERKTRKSSSTGPVREKHIAKKWTAANSIPRSDSNPLRKHQQRSTAVEGYKVPLTKDELNRAMKRAGLAQATQALSNNARSNERLKEQCVVVRSASTCSGRVHGVYGPKERSVNKKNQSEHVLKRVCQNGDKKKNVGSQVLPPESHAHEVPHLSRPPLPIDSKQRKGTQESVDKGQEKVKSRSRSASRGTGVTVVKPFSFETEKRHQRYLKLMEEKGTVGDSSRRNEHFGLAKQSSCPDLKTEASATQTVHNDGHHTTPPSSKTPMPSSRMATPRASALSEIFPNCAGKKTRESSSTVVNRFGSPASGLRMPSAKKLTTPKPFRFLSASPCAINGPGREKHVAKKWTAVNSISRGGSNPLHKHQQRSAVVEGYKVPLTKDELNSAMKGAGLAQATQALSSKARSNERLKEQCVVVRSASTCSGRVQAVYGPKERSVSKKNQSDDILKRICQNGDKKKNVGSQVLQPESHAHEVPHLSRPPLPIDSKQRKGTQESVGKVKRR